MNATINGHTYTLTTERDVLAFCSRHLATQLPQSAETCVRVADSGTEISEPLFGDDLLTQGANLGAAILQGVFGLPGPMPAHVVRR